MPVIRKPFRVPNRFKFTFNHVIYVIVSLSLLVSYFEYISTPKGNSFGRNSPSSDQLQVPDSGDKLFDPLGNLISSKAKNLLVKKRLKVFTCQCNASKYSDYAQCVEGEESDKRQRDLREADLILKRNTNRRVHFMKLNSAFSPSTTTPENYLCPVYPCFREQRLGEWRFGGKWVCFNQKFPKVPIIYSIGSNDDAPVLKAMHKATKSKAYVIDPTQTRTNHSLPYIHVIKMKKYSKTILQQHPDFDSDDEFEMVDFASEFSRQIDQMKSIHSAINRLNHHQVDILIIDRDFSSNYAVSELLSIWKTSNLPQQVLLQVCSTFAHFQDKLLFKNLERRGYLLFHLEKSWTTPPCVEISYIHKRYIKY